MKPRSLLILTVAATLLCAGVRAAIPPVWPPPPPCIDPPYCPYFPSFQGFLTDQGIPANGLFDIITRIYDAPTGGNLIGPPTTNRNVQVQRGLFSIYLKVPPGLSNLPSPDGDDTWWMEHCIQHPEDPICQVIEPRQRISPTVQSLYANVAASVKDGAVTAGKLAPGAVANIALGDGSVTASKIANGAAVRSLNGLREDLLLAAGEGITLSTMGNAIQIAAAPGPAVRDCRDYTNCYWNLLGNGNIDPGVHFLGTIAGELAPLEMRVNGNRCQVYVFTGADTSPNTIGGYKGNVVSGVGGTISGGGQLTGINEVYSDWGTVGGGITNMIRALAPGSTIGGGIHHSIDNFSEAATIGGGKTNVVMMDSRAATVGGGANNTIGQYCWYTTLCGGESNLIAPNSVYAAIGGGGGNNVSGTYSSIGGGDHNAAGGSLAAIGGGGLNYNAARGGTIGGGVSNIVSAAALLATISGGGTNLALGSFATVSGGNRNRASGLFATVAGGQNSVVSAPYGTVSGGAVNTVTADYATVPGGTRAVASHYGEVAQANGAFANNGDAQASCFVLRTNTSPAAPQGELFLDGSSRRMTLAVGATWTFDILVTARSDAGTSAGYQLRGVIENVGGVTAFVGVPIQVVLGEDVAAWDAQVTTSATDALEIKVLGDPQSNIRWVATVRTAQVSNP